MKLQDYINKHGNVEIEEKQLNELLGIKESKVWKPKYDDNYYCIYADGDVIELTYYGTDFDNGCLLRGNVYQTKEQAKFALEKRKVEVELQRFAIEHNEGEIDWENSYRMKYYLGFSYFSNKVSSCSNCAFRGDNVYFTSQKIAEQAIEAIGEDRLKKYYFGVE